MHATAHAWDVLAVLVAVGAYLYVRRHGGGLALAELERANRILSQRVTELERENAVLQSGIAELRLKTDVAGAVAPVLAALETHEVGAVERTNKTLVVLEMIADRLSPDENHG